MFLMPLSLIFVAVVGLWTLAAHNRLIGLRHQTTNGWHQIDVQLKRQHDLIPKLVNAVKDVIEFERDALKLVEDARAKAVAASSPADAARKERVLSAAVCRLFALAENNPQPHANEHLELLQQELSSAGNRIRFARQFYNDVAARYNTSRQTFPINLVASSCGFKPAELFDANDDNEGVVPSVDLSVRR